MSTRLEAWRNKTSRKDILATRLPDGRILCPWQTIQLQALPVFEFPNSEKSAEPKFENEEDQLLAAK